MKAAAGIRAVVSNAIFARVSMRQYLPGCIFALDRLLLGSVDSLQDCPLGRRVEYDLVMDREPSPSHAYRWIWIASIWLGFGLVGAMQTVFVMRSEGMHHAWVKLFFVSVLSWLPWSVATPLVMRLGQRFPPVKLSWVTGLVHIVGCVAVGLAFSAWTAWLDWLLNPYAYPSRPAPFV